MQSIFHRILQNIPGGNLLLTKQLKTKEFQTLDVIPFTERPTNNTQQQQQQRLRWEMGPIESAFMTLDQENSGANRIFFEVKVRGTHATKDQLKSGLKQVQDKYPPMQCRLKRLSCGSWIYEQDHTMEIAMKWLSSDNNNAQSLFKRRMGEKWQPPSDNQPNESSNFIVWVFFTSDTTNNNGEKFQHFIFELPHTVMDGNTLGYFVHDVLTFTFESSTKNQQPTNITPPFPSCVESTIMNMNDFYYSNNNFIRMWNIIKAVIFTIRTLFLYSYAVLLQQQNSAAKYQETIVFHQILNKDETTKFHSMCRKHNVTITSAVMAAYIYAIGSYIKKSNNSSSKFRLATLAAADIRNLSNELIQPEHCASMHTSSVCYLTQEHEWDNHVNTTSQMWKEATEIRASMKSQMDNHLPIGVACLAGMALNADAIRKTPPVSLVMSSWGAKNPIKEIYGDGTIIEDVSLAQPFTLEAHPTLSCYMVAGKLHLTLMAGIPAMNEQVMEEISIMGSDFVRQMMVED
jgi:hypothetical protein